MSCGIKEAGNPRNDLALIYSDHPCVSAGTFTTNRVKAAPVKVTQAHLRAMDLRAVVANSGNANACTGVPGITDARAMAKTVASSLGLRQREVGICSTGVIGSRCRWKGCTTGWAICLHSSPGMVDGRSRRQS